MKNRALLALGLVTASACATAPPEAVPGSALPPPVELPALRPTNLPPPVSGGTLIVARDGKTAIAADPDRDLVYVIDVSAGRLLRTVTLRPGDEPGRLVEDGARRVHVALRGTGALATIDIESGAVSERRPVCGAPRGVAFDAASGLLHVACATGELVSLPAAGGGLTRRLTLGTDLRDVIVQGSHLLVSRLKKAELLELDAAGQEVRREAPPEFTGVVFPPEGQQQTLHTPATVAWRAVGLPAGGAVVVHTRGVSDPIDTKRGGYGSGPCKGSIVNSTVSVLDGTNRLPAGPMIQVALPVDLAVSADGSKFAIVDASRVGVTAGLPAVFTGPLAAVGHDCHFPATLNVSGQATAVAFDGQGRVLTQTREPAALHVEGAAAPIALSGVSRRDEGHELFHGATRAMLACASCHPEGGDDGHVWTFAGIEAAGPRRTQSLRGGILGTEPFHWSGDMPTLTHLSDEVMTRRMMGPQLTAAQVSVLGGWLDGQPHLPAPPQDSAAVSRGRALFNDAALGCAGCHSGSKLGANRNEDVGTGGAFQVPALRGVAYRAPFMHDGCAASLRDRFGACGGERHGHTSQLSAAQQGDLAAYLSAL